MTVKKTPDDNESNKSRPEWLPLLIEIPIREAEVGKECMEQLRDQTDMLVASGYQPTGVPAITSAYGCVLLFQWYVLTGPDPEQEPEEPTKDMDDD